VRGDLLDLGLFQPHQSIGLRGAFLGGVGGGGGGAFFFLVCVIVSRNVSVIDMVNSSFRFSIRDFGGTGGGSDPAVGVNDPSLLCIESRLLVIDGDLKKNQDFFFKFGVNKMFQVANND
jgi:hypothetical protein